MKINKNIFVNKTFLLFVFVSISLHSFDLLCCSFDTIFVVNAFKSGGAVLVAPKGTNSTGAKFSEEYSA